MYYGIPVWASHEWLLYRLFIYLDIRWNCGINFTSRSSRGITLEYIEELWKHLCKQTACGYPWHTSCFWLWGKTHELKCVKNEFICKCILIIKLFATAQAIFIRLVNLKSYMDQQDLISIMITRSESKMHRPTSTKIYLLVLLALGIPKRCTIVE